MTRWRRLKHRLFGCRLRQEWKVGRGYYGVCRDCGREASAWELHGCPWFNL